MTTTVVTCKESEMYENKGMYWHAKIIIHHTEKTRSFNKLRTMSKAVYSSRVFPNLCIPFPPCCKPVTWSWVSVVRP